MTYSKCSATKNSGITKTLYGYTIQDFFPESFCPSEIPRDIASELDFVKVEQQLSGLNRDNQDHLNQLTVNSALILRELYSYGRGSLINYLNISECISRSFENVAYVQCIQRMSGKTSAFCTKLARECFPRIDSFDFDSAACLTKRLKTLNKPQYLAKNLFLALCEGRLDAVSMNLCELKNLTSNFDDFKSTTNRFYRDENSILVNYKNN